MRSRTRDGSLLTRVTLVAVLSAAGGGLAAAISATLVADRAIELTGDQRLRDQASALLDELAAAPPADLKRESDDEARELAALGLRIAVYHDGARLGGDPVVPLIAPGCQTTLDGAHRVRRCAVARGARTAVVSMDRLAETRWSAYAIATFVALVTATILGAIASRATAQWAVGPLTRLRDRVGRSDDDLGEDEGVREVDTLRAALRESLARSAMAAATAQRFAADAAHELRTPLATISAELELVEEQLAAAETREALLRARRSVAALSRVIERLLVLARAGGGELVEAADAVMLGEVLEGLRTPEIDVQGEGAVRGDETLLTKMLENALQNAQLHGRPPIAVTVSERGDEVTIDIVDSGPGIHGEDRERLFEPFVRGTGTGREGFGLGLALIAQVARAHGGTASFVEASRGAHLRIVLPKWQPR